MKYAADFRQEARAALQGKWPLAILVGEDPLSGICHDAVGCHADDAHELPGGLPLAQFFFLSPIHGSSLHS